MGDKPLIDLMKSTDWFEKQPWIDKDRMAAAGASYGGFMMAWLNGHTDRFQAMVCHAGVFDWHAMLASDMIMKANNSLLWHKEVFAWLDKYIGTGATK
jgi:dipeptidyl aminopeptidase/acylaminoacyl peptidase